MTYAYDSGPMLVLRCRFGDRLEPHEATRLATLTAADFAEANQLLDAHPAYAARLAWQFESEQIRVRYRPADGSTGMDAVVASMAPVDRARYLELQALLATSHN